MKLVDAAVKTLELASKVRQVLSAIAEPGPELEQRLERIPARLGPYGVDPFGFEPTSLRSIVGVMQWLYRSYFRVQAFGAENIPEGRCFVIANHSGQLPFDAAMITAAAFLEREPPRFLRSMVERFVPSTPYVSVFLSRWGQILGTPENCRRLLEAEEAIQVFPEGVRGLNKTWPHRYQLQRFGTGFMRLALEMDVPIVPVALIGAEEQAPSFYNFTLLGKLLGLPSMPVTPLHPLLPGLGLLPLPTRYRIYFGKPMRFVGDCNDEDEIIQGKVDEVKGAIQGMIDEGLAARQHIFR